MSMSRGGTTLRHQAAAVERAACNLRGHVANLGDLVARGKRPAAELWQQEAWLDALMEAAVTMRRLADGAP
jgi:hypothetical protein